MPIIGGIGELPPRDTMPPVVPLSPYQTPRAGEEPFIAGGQFISFAQTFACANNTAVTITVRVPSNEVWWIYHMTVRNGDNVSRNATCYVTDSRVSSVSWSAMYVYYLAAVEAVAATNVLVIPSSVATGYNETQIRCTPFPIFSNQEITLTLAAGGASAGGLCYLHMQRKIEYGGLQK